MCRTTAQAGIQPIENTYAFNLMLNLGDSSFINGLDTRLRGYDDQCPAAS